MCYTVDQIEEPEEALAPVTRGNALSDQTQPQCLSLCFSEVIIVDMHQR